MLHVDDRKCKREQCLETKQARNLHAATCARIGLQPHHENLSQMWCMRFLVLQHFPTRMVAIGCAGGASNGPTRQCEECKSILHVDLFCMELVPVCKACLPSFYQASKALQSIAFEASVAGGTVAAMQPPSPCRAKQSVHNGDQIQVRSSECRGPYPLWLS